MTTGSAISPWLIQSLRWIARAMSTLAAALWLLILLDILACDALVGFICVNWEMAFLAGIVVFSVSLVWLTWRRESLGGSLMILWGVIFSAIAYTSSRKYLTLSLVLTGVPFIISGCLFMFGGWLSDKGREMA